MPLIEILSALLGIVGALLLATRSRFAGWAFVAWFISNVGWMVFGAGNQHWFFIVQQMVFLGTSILGIWTWLLNPPERQIEQPSPEQEKLIRQLIEQKLDADNVGLTMGSHVLHTTAPVTYGCLRRLVLQGMSEGIAAERERRGGAR